MGICMNLQRIRNKSSKRVVHMENCMNLYAYGYVHTMKLEHIVKTSIRSPQSPRNATSKIYCPQKCKNTQMRENIYVRVYIYQHYMLMYVFTKICIYVCIFTKVYVFVRVHVNMYICTHAYLYIRMPDQSVQYIEPVQPEQ